MPTSLFDLLGEDVRGLIWDLVAGRVAWMRARMDEAVGTKDAHMAIGEWKKLHGGKDHPLCAVRLVCKSTARRLRSLVLMECRVNSVFRTKKGVVPRRKSEEVFLDGFLDAFLFPFSHQAAKRTTPELRAEWSRYCLHVLAIRITNAVANKNDLNATNMYTAIKHCINHYLGDSRPGTGCAREPHIRKRFAMLFTRIAGPVDLLGSVQVRPNQRQRRPLTDLINIHSAGW